ncbi:MAG: hypothetical protein JETCAE02_26990 [Anaerolineaceae bacterium]|nr:MAG: hypothetical protein JETCAE02_26990 [Anaerolineaceae bacterium]
MNQTKKGRPPKNGKRVSVLMPREFARYARAKGAAVGLTCGEWLAWRLEGEFAAWSSAQESAGAARQPGDRPG